MNALKPFLFCLSYLLTLTCSAQPFQPDAYGYVSDPAFLKLIQSRKYLIVGTYDSIKELPGIYAAIVYKDSSTLCLLDINGKELAVPEETTQKAYDLPSEPISKKTPSPFRMFEQKGQFGVRNSTGTKILDAEFDTIAFHKHNDSIFFGRKKEKWGIYLADGRELLKPTFEKIVGLKNAEMYPTTAFAVCENEKWGLLSHKGEVTVEPLYKFIRENDPFSEVLTLVVNDKVGFMDRNGKVYCEPKYQHVYYEPNYARYGIQSYQKEEGKRGLLDIRTGRAFDFNIHRRSKKDFYEIVRNDGSKNIYGIRNLATGKEIIGTDYAIIRDYNNGRWLVERYSENGILLKGVFDTLGNELIPVKYEYLLGDFYNGWSLYGNGRMYGVINLKNEVIIPPKYESLEIIALYNRKADDFRKLDSLIFSKERKLGVMDLNENIIIQPVYTKIRSSNTGLMVLKNRQNGVISFDGKERIPFEYDWLNDGSKSGIFKGRKSGRYYLLDLYGNSMEFTLTFDER